MMDKSIILKPGIPGVSRQPKELKHPVRVLAHETQEFKIIAERALREAERQEVRRC